MIKLNHRGLRVHATVAEKAFVGPCPPTKISLACRKCGAARLPKTSCVVCSRVAKAAYKIRHVEKVKAARSAYKKALHASKAAERAEKKAARRASLKERRRVAKRAWAMRNKGAMNATTARRHAAKMKAVPKWANRFFVGEAYHLAQLRTQATGFAWHVDHIVPLRSKFVCGLHNEFNLQVIPASANMNKGNRHWPDMPERLHG